MVHETIGYDARSCALFVFYGKRKDAVKVLFFDGTGMAIFYKRFDSSVVHLPSELAPETKQLGGEGTDFEGPLASADDESPASPPPESKGRKPKTTATARRNLRNEDMPEKRIELLDPAFEGKYERIRFEESCRQGYQRGGPVRIVLARAIYKVPLETEQGSENEPVVELVTVAKPKELVERGLLAPSLIAHLLVSKYLFGIPFHRLALMLRAQGVRLDDGTMCRYAEDVGATLGCIVDTMACEAKESAFCLSMDATGVGIQPEPLATGKRQACRKGHFFVVLADQDHVFFEYQREHTSKAVCEMFRGFGGYVQADAHVIYDALFRGDARASADDDVPTEVGCLAHCRRRFWEAASAFGYAVRQKEPLCRFLDDGRLAITNNHSERALRSPICAGRKAWLFFGSDDHASAAANLFSLIASCQLHGLDPEAYLAETVRIVPLWPRERYLELAPRYWAATRARLDPAELANELGPITVPPPLAAEQERSSN